MNTFAAVAVVALLAYTVHATPCTDICGARCALRKQACDVAQLFGNFCDVLDGACTQACTAACGCADGCSQECGAEFATCQESGASSNTGPLASLPGGLGANMGVLACGVNLPMCQFRCQLKCSFNNLATAANALGGGASEQA